MLKRALGFLLPALFVIAVVLLAAFIALHGRSGGGKFEPTLGDYHQDSKSERLARIERWYEERRIDPTPEDILQAQRSILKRYTDGRRSGIPEDAVLRRIARVSEFRERMGYPMEALELETARKSVVAHLREVYGKANSQAGRKVALTFAMVHGISPDEISAPADPQVDAMAEAAANKIRGAEDAEGVALALEPLRAFDLSEKGLALIVNAVPELELQRAVPVLEFLSAYRERKLCVELLDRLSRSEDIGMVRHALTNLSHSWAEGVDGILFEILSREDIPEDIRLSAIGSLLRWSEIEDVAAAIAGELGKYGPEWQSQALVYLGQHDLRFSAPALFDAVIDKADSEDNRVARASIEALSRVSGNKQVISVLLSFAQDTERPTEMRLAALKNLRPTTLAFSDGPRETVVALSQSEEPAIRQAAQDLLQRTSELKDQLSTEAQMRDTVHRIKEVLQVWQAQSQRLAGRTDPESARQKEELDRMIEQMRGVLEQVAPGRME